MENHQSIRSPEPEFRLFEELFDCRLCVHDYSGLFFFGEVPLLNRIRSSHRRTFPAQCGRESRRYCLAHCNDELNRRIAECSPRDLFMTHCRSGCFELASPVYRHGRCILIIFAGILDPQDKEKVRRIARMLPVFAAGIEARLRAASGIFRSGSIPDRVREYAAEHYREPVSTADAAKALFISVSRLCHLLQQENTTFSALLTEERIRRVKHMLLHSDFRMREIAGLCGYSSYEHFCRVFRQMTGTAPGTWRRGKRS